MPWPPKYARAELERRFLLDRFSADGVTRIRHITDCYLDGARLRLREQREDGAPAIYKLTQKVPARANGAQPVLVTTLYLTEEEFHLISRLPGKMLSKIRYSVPPFGIDVFEGPLRGLRLAEAEFASDAEANALKVPDFILHEVTKDQRFTGGQLVSASRRTVGNWLAEYGMERLLLDDAPLENRQD